MDIPGPVLGNATDDEIAKLIKKYPTLTKGILDEVVRIARMEPPESTSGDNLLERIDKLDGTFVYFLRCVASAHDTAGPVFTNETLCVAGIDYGYCKRNLGDIVSLLLDRIGDKLEIPSLRAADTTEPISTLWHGSEYQRHLQEFVKAGGDLTKDLLLPLVFFSGARVLLCIP